MSDLGYFEYALVLPEEHYLIEVQTRKPGGEVRGQAEIEGIAKECLATAVYTTAPPETATTREVEVEGDAITISIEKG